MDELRRAAVARFVRADESTKRSIRKLFNEIDKDGSGRISQEEFAEALKRQLGYKEEEKKELLKLFRQLDTDYDRQLDLYEALAFLHLVQNKMAALFCSACSVLLTGPLYFSCLECHIKHGKSYHLCVDCYENKGKSKDHMHRLLYDNIHLLQIYRMLVADLKYGGSRASGGGGQMKPKEKLMVMCDGCSALFGGRTYFSCILCHEIKVGIRTCDVCIDCYRGGRKCRIRHKSSSFYDNNTLLQAYKRTYTKLIMINALSKPNTSSRRHAMQTALEVTSNVVRVADKTCTVVDILSDFGSIQNGSGAVGVSNVAQSGSGVPFGASLVDDDYVQNGSSVVDIAAAQSGYSLYDDPTQLSSASLVDAAGQSSSSYSSVVEAGDVGQSGSSFIDATGYDGSSLFDATEHAVAAGSSLTDVVDGLELVSNVIDMAGVLCSIM